MKAKPSRKLLWKSVTLTPGYPEMGKFNENKRKKKNEQRTNGGKERENKKGTLCLLLHPQQKGVLGGELVDGNVLDLEAKNHCPDQTEGETGVSFDDIVGTNVLHLDLLLLEVIQTLSDVGSLDIDSLCGYLQLILHCEKKKI